MASDNVWEEKDVKTAESASETDLNQGPLALGSMLYVPSSEFSPQVAPGVS